MSTSNKAKKTTTTKKTTTKKLTALQKAQAEIARLKEQAQATIEQNNELTLQLEQSKKEIVEIKATNEKLQEQATKPKKGTKRRGNATLKQFAIRSAIVVAYWHKKFAQLILDTEHDDYCANIILNNRQMKKALFDACDKGLGQFLFSRQSDVRDSIRFELDNQKKSVKQFVNEDRYNEICEYVETNKTRNVPFADEIEQYKYSVCNQANWAYGTDYSYSGSQFGGEKGIGRFCIYAKANNRNKNIMSAIAKNKQTGVFYAELDSFNFEFLSEDKRNPDHNPKIEMLYGLLSLAPLYKEDPKMFIQKIHELADDPIAFMNKQKEQTEDK